MVNDRSQDVSPCESATLRMTEAPWRRRVLRDMCRLRERVLRKVSVIKWMNRPPHRDEPYHPTKVEHVANIITHLLVIIPSYKGTLILLKESDSAVQKLCAVVYGCALIALFVVSSVFHGICAAEGNTHLRRVFHRLDRAIIYLFIAASYTPWLVLRNFRTQWDRYQIFIVWTFCLAGIMYQRKFHERYKTLSVIMYCVVAVFPIVTVLNMNPLNGIDELALGGFIYLLGVLFFKLDGRVPLAHAIWHICVNAAAYVHFMAIAHHLYNIVPRSVPPGEIPRH